MSGVVNNFVYNRSDLVLFCIMHQIFFLVQNCLLASRKASEDL